MKVKTLVVAGIFPDVLNENGRIYPLDLLKKTVKEYEPHIENNTSYGELIQNSESSSHVVSLCNVSHKINNLFFKKDRMPRKKKKKLKKQGNWIGLKNRLMAEVEFSDSDSGKAAEILSGSNIGMRAIGSVGKDGVVGEDLSIISFDIIAPN